MKWMMSGILVVAMAAASAQTTAPAPKPAAPALKPAAPAPKLSEHAQNDIVRHRAMAAAHEAAAKCFESGQSEEACHKQLRTACKGLAIGKYCGMRHEH